MWGGSIFIFLILKIKFIIERLESIEGYKGKKRKIYLEFYYVFVREYLDVLFFRFVICIFNIVGRFLFLKCGYFGRILFIDLRICEI